MKPRRPCEHGQYDPHPALSQRDSRLYDPEGCPGGEVLPMKLAPVKLREARAFVAEHHRHNRPPQGWKFGVSLRDDEGTILGVAIAATPVARMLDDGDTIEISRVCTIGDKNANSMLYGAILRAAKALGFHRAITYTLDSESGVSLLASGWSKDGELPGTQDWNRLGQVRVRAPMLFEDRYPQHDGAKIRWVKRL